MNLIIDEPLARVELASSLSIYYEDIATFNSRGGAASAGSTADIVIGQDARIEAADPSKLANSRFGGNIGAHVQGAICVADHIVMGKGACCTGDLDIVRSSA